jgi:hypothetical protein
MNFSLISALVLICLLTTAFPKKTFADEKKIVGSISTKGLSRSDYTKGARISSSQAAKSATSAVSGSVLSIGLEDEDGFLVYAVEVIHPPSELHEVLVDAGNSKVLDDQKKDKSRSVEDDEDDDQD